MAAFEVITEGKSTESRDRIRLLVETLTLLAVVFYGYMAVRQWREQISARHQTQAAINAAGRSATAAELANNNIVQAERPWIGLSDFMADPLESDKKITIQLQYLNTGKRPADIILQEFSTRPYKAFPSAPRYEGITTKPSHTFLVPGIKASAILHVKLPQSELARRTTAKESTYIYGHVDYIDPSTHCSHTTHICEVWQPTRGAYNLCSTYNDAN